MLFGAHPDDRYGLVVDAILSSVGEDDPLYSNASCLKRYIAREIFRILVKLPALQAA